MFEISKRNLYINQFENITDLSIYLDKPRKQGRDDASEHGSESFTGTKNYKEAYDFLKYGDENLYSKIKKEKEKLNIDKFLGNVSNRLRYEKRIYGAIPNVPAYLINNPINMISPEKNQLSHRILNIFLDIGVCCGVDTDEIIRNGMLYLNVIDLLEKKGYRCNLYAGASTRCDDKNFYMLVRVKTDREPLNMKKICFPLASPSMLRRIFFRWEEVFDYDFDITNRNYGRDVELSCVSEQLNENLKQNFIVWSYNDGDGNSRTIETILDDLEKQGIKIKD